MKFVRLVLASLTLAFAVGQLIVPVSAAESTKRPNIVWIIVDEMSPNFSTYGEMLIQTPAVDRMAAEPDRVYVSDMAVYFQEIGPKNVKARQTIERNTEQMRQWAREGKYLSVSPAMIPFQLA